MAKMKILSDFDGVLTEQTEEALQVRDHFRTETARFLGLDLNQKNHSDKIDSLFREGEAEMIKNPTLHGWRHLNRISAYSNEDLFIRNNALAAVFDEWAKKENHELASCSNELKKNGIADFYALAGKAFDRMAQETMKHAKKPIDADTRRLILAAIEKGYEFVIVSNSGTERIENMLRAGDIPVHPKLRVRGGARKFELAADSSAPPVSSSKISSFRVSTAQGLYEPAIDRPVYEAILREEKPNAVIGDVFSLDLALPAHLSNDPAFPALHLYLRVRDYTPAWSKDFFSKKENPLFPRSHFHAIRSLPEILDGPLFR